MRKKAAAVIIGLAWTAHVAAAEGVLFEYVLTEEVSPTDITTSEFGFLTTFGQQSSIDIGNTAKLDIIAEDHQGQVLLTLTLTDYAPNGSRQLVGSQSLFLPYGESSNVHWPSLHGVSYNLAVKPTRRPIASGES